MKVHLRFRSKRILPIHGSAARLAHGLQHIGRNRPFEDLLRGRRVVAGRSPCAGLVLHLHNDHRALRVKRLQVAHERGEHADIQLLRRGTERRWRIRRSPVLVRQMEITRRVGLHPLGHVVLAAVLPCAEPEQIQTDMVFARLGDDGVHHRVVVLFRLWFELLPVDRDLERIGVEILDGRPYLRKHARPAARIMRLGPQHQVRRAIHHQSVAPILLHYLRDGSLFRLRLLRGGGATDGQKSHHRGPSPKSSNMHVGNVLASVL